MEWISIREATEITGKSSGSILWAIHTGRINGRVRYETEQYKHWEVEKSSLLAHFNAKKG